MYSVGDRVMVDDAANNQRYEGVVQKVAQNEKTEVMYLVMGEGWTAPMWQKQEAVYAIIRTE